MVEKAQGDKSPTYLSLKADIDRLRKETLDCKPAWQQYRQVSDDIAKRQRALAAILGKQQKAEEAICKAQQQQADLRQEEAAIKLELEALQE
eukprot:4973792-Lingulodinium_polyedra.AAC.1